ncbi:MAG: guanylate kinase [Fusobacteria bacterium]|nr:guanylate kinase [Fusobacteriota bacterium]
MEEKNLLIVVSGPSGAGKGTICKALTDKNKDKINCAISATSREIRPGEVDKQTYYYIGRDSFIKEIANNNFLEYAEVYGNYYGTLKEEVERLLNSKSDVILEIDMQGALQIRERTNDAVLIFIMPPSFEELRERICNRQRESQEEIKNRLTKVDNELKYIKEYDYIVVNDDLDIAVKKIEAILTAEKCKVNNHCLDMNSFVSGVKNY